MISKQNLNNVHLPETALSWRVISKINRLNFLATQSKVIVR